MTQTMLEYKVEKAVYLDSQEVTRNTENNENMQESIRIDTPTPFQTNVLDAQIPVVVNGKTITINTHLLHEGIPYAFVYKNKYRMLVREKGVTKMYEVTE